MSILGCGYAQMETYLNILRIYNNVKTVSISYLLKGSLADTVVSDAQPLLVVFKLSKHS